MLIQFQLSIESLLQTFPTQLYNKARLNYLTRPQLLYENLPNSALNNHER